MRPVLLALAACLAVLAPAALPVGAQVVDGTVQDADRGHPLPRAQLYLLDHDGIVVDSVLTDPAGRFRLTAPRAGTYHVLFQMDGWVTVPFDSMRLDPGATATLDLQVPLIAVSALQQMGELLRMEQRLQDALPEICGEAFRPWEAGLLVGVVRVRATREPLAGARVTVATGSDGVARSTLSNERGTYVLCNVPTGPDVQIIAEAPDGTRETTTVEIRAGTASWYELPLGPRPARGGGRDGTS
jgi:hypothetical protein